jgi:hypothetical protein
MGERCKKTRLLVVNWPFDLMIGCFKPFHLTCACKVDSKFIEKFVVEFENEVEHEEFANLCDVFFVKRSAKYNLLEAFIVGPLNIGSNLKHLLHAFPFDIYDI